MFNKYLRELIDQEVEKIRENEEIYKQKFPDGFEVVSVNSRGQESSVFAMVDNLSDVEDYYITNIRTTNLRSKVIVYEIDGEFNRGELVNEYEGMSDTMIKKLESYHQMAMGMGLF